MEKEWYSDFDIFWSALAAVKEAGTCPTTLYIPWKLYKDLFGGTGERVSVVLRVGGTAITILSKEKEEEKT